MKWAALLCVLSLGCGGSLAEGGQAAVAGAKKALVGVDIVAETTAPGLVEARRIAIAACRDKQLPTPDAREDCLGPLAKPMGPTALAIAEAYDRALDALNDLDRNLAEMAAMREAAKAVEGAD